MMVLVKIIKDNQFHCQNNHKKIDIKALNSTSSNKDIVVPQRSPMLN